MMIVDGHLKEIFHDRCATCGAPWPCPTAQRALDSLLGKLGGQPEPITPEIIDQHADCPYYGTPYATGQTHHHPFPQAVIDATDPLDADDAG